MVPTFPLDQGRDDIQVMVVVAVCERRAENLVSAFGEEVAALVHLDEGVTALDGVQLGGHVARRAVRTSQ